MKQELPMGDRRIAELLAQADSETNAALQGVLGDVALTEDLTDPGFYRAADSDRIPSVDDSGYLPDSVKVADANLPARLQDTALNATIAAATAPKLDSAAAASTYARARHSMPGAFVAYLGDSNTQGTGNGGEDYCDYATALSGARLRMVEKYGFAGYRADMLLPKVTDTIIPSGATSCFVLAGTNDAGADATVATYMTRMTAIFDALRGAGITPIAGTVPPRVDKRLQVSQYNAALTRYCTRAGIPIVDFHKLLVDTATGGLKAAYDTGDAIHINGAGHYVMGKEIAAKIAPLVPYSEPWLTTETGDLTNLVANGLFADANADGQADTWIRSVGTAAPTYAIVDDARFVGKAQKLSFNAISGYRSFYQNITTGFAPGDRLGFGFAYAIDNPASMVVGNGFKFQYTLTGPGTLAAPISGQVNAVSRGVWWQEIVVPAGVTGIKFEYSWSAGATGVADFYIAQATMRNLTALGIV